MSLIPYGPLHVQRQNRLMAELGDAGAAALTQLLSTDIIETETAFLVHVDIPGVEGLEANMGDGFLTISGYRPQQHAQESFVAHKVERSFGKVERRVSLPFDADFDNAQANYKNGVLSVSVPKKKPTEIKRITVG